MVFINNLFNNLSRIHFCFNNSFFQSLKPHVVEFPDILFHRLSNMFSKYEVVGVVCPKNLLNSLLPKLKKSCSAKFVVFGNTISGFESASNLRSVDAVLCEPVCFSQKGFCFPFSDIKFLKNKDFFACASLLQYSSFIPHFCDVLKKGRLVCESGVFSLDNVVLEVKSKFPEIIDNFE